MARHVSLPVIPEFSVPEVIPHDYAGKMTVRVARAIAGSLGHPSKMPGYSYGISAERCQTGGKLRGVRGSVCSGCYAMTDWYRTWRPLLEGHRRRWQGIHHPLWVDAMVCLIDSAYKKLEERRFRWHDSGDLQGVWHLAAIAAVCARTPTVSYWLPTREYGFVAEYLRDREIPPNLTVRLSAHMIDSEPVVPPELVDLPVSAVASVPYGSSGVRVVEGKGSIECRAVEARDNKCGDCRACWDARVKCVTYPQH
jgi:hypothetical protein